MARSSLFPSKSAPPAAPRPGDRVIVKRPTYPNARAHDRGEPVEYTYEGVVVKNMHPGDPMPDIMIEVTDFFTHSRVYPVPRNRTSPASRRGYWITPDADDDGEPADFDDAFLEPPVVGDRVLFYDVVSEPRGELSVAVIRPIPGEVVAVLEPDNPFSPLDINIPVKSREVIACGRRCGGGWFFPSEVNTEATTSEPITEEKPR